MLFNSRKTIGVIAENTANEFQHKLCNGIIRSAWELGYNVALFSSHGSYGQSELFRLGDTQFYQLPPYEELCGMILVLDTMDNEDSKQRLVNTVKSRCNCPVVSMRIDWPGFHSVLVDNRTCMESVIRHFVEHHGFRRLCFMTGPKSHIDAEERLQCFKDLMSRYGLPVGEHQYYYGDFWKFEGPAACDWFLADEETPEAIICANDYMAVAVASELISRGYRVPEDICVSGYDGLDSTISFSPSMTTACAPFEEMGSEAVQLIHRQQGKLQTPQRILLESKLILRESCGCVTPNDLELLRLRRDHHDSLQLDNDRSLAFSFMSSQLAAAKTMEEVSEMLPDYLEHFSHLRSFAICLNQNLTLDRKLFNYTDQVEIRTAMKDGVPMPDVNIPFDKKLLIPAEFTDDTPQAWYFTPLHFLDHCLGYEAFRFEDEAPAGLCNFHFDVIVFNKIYETLVYDKMERMISELQRTSLQDALTGLYNRGGFTKYGDQLFEHARHDRIPVFMAVLDMDNLKKINDRFGHIEGDFAIKKIADAISKYCGGSYIFGRTGGDEFYVIGTKNSDEKGQECLSSVEEEMVRFNSGHTKDYEIHVSFGSYMDVPKPQETLDDFIKVADHFMYHNKITNKKRRGDVLR